MDIIGIRGSEGFDAVTKILLDSGCIAAVMEPLRVIGRVHIISAWEHALRSFSNGKNRSRTIMTEFLLYMAGERQISKALSLMRPIGNDIVIFFPNGLPGAVSELKGERDDSLADASDNKAMTMGFERSGMDIPYEDMALEMVAMTDVLKD